MINVASAHLELGELEPARRSSEEALRLCERITSPHAAATARSALADAEAAGREIRRGNAMTALALVIADPALAEAAVRVQVATGHALAEARAREALSQLRRSQAVAPG